MKLKDRKTNVIVTTDPAEIAKQVVEKLDKMAENDRMRDYIKANYHEIRLVLKRRERGDTDCMFQTVLALIPKDVPIYLEHGYRFPEIIAAIYLKDGKEQPFGPHVEREKDEAK